MKIVICGLAITSSWGNGHATTFRALTKALHERGHKVIFFEKDLYWYADNRDLPHPKFCDVRIFRDWKKAVPEIKRELADADVAMVGSYFPDGIAAIDLMLESRVPVTTFYDIDTPITVAQLRSEGGTPYLRRDQIPGIDLYFSFTGGPLLTELERVFNAKRALPLYCSFDERLYRRREIGKRYRCDLSYMGTYAPDRQPKINELFVKVAEQEPGRSFILAGPQYPKSIRWPKNVRRIEHLNPRWHPHLYSSSRFVLNVTRRDMVACGYSPSVRLFEAAACGATMVSDNWPGLEAFFRPGSEILLPTSAADVRTYLHDLNDASIRRIGDAAQSRVLEAHTSHHRALEFEEAVRSAATRSRRPPVDGTVETPELIRASL
jgi:spore maturation protein CgeB